MKQLFALALFASLAGTMSGAVYTVYYDNSSATSVTGVSNSVTYATGANPVIGRNVNINSTVEAQVDNGAENPVLLACAGCLLSFTTGNETGLSGNTYSFGSGGSLTIRQGANTIVTGSFTTPVSVTGNGFGREVTAGVILDTQSTAFNALVFGPGVVGSSPWSGTLSLSFNASFTGGVLPGFTSTNVNANTPVLANSSSAPIPEPTSAALYSALAGALGLGLWRRRQAAR